MGKQICLVPQLKGLGGMVSFQAKFIQGLQNREVSYSFNPLDPNNDAILIIGGWKKLNLLLKARHKGFKVFQRLDGMNWLHTVQKTTLKDWLHAEMANLLLAFIRRYVCHEVIYQSNFSQSWWEVKRGKLRKPTHVIRNGVDLNTYSPNGPETPPTDLIRILLVEGHLNEKSAGGLNIACQLAKLLQDRVNLPVGLAIAGDVPLDVQDLVKERYSDVAIHWLGIVPSPEIPALDRSAHLFFSADLNAACPNSVIEALACGLPVLSFDTGALSEIVTPEAGAVVAYGSDHWKLEQPDVAGLVEAALRIIFQNQQYRDGARTQAERYFSLDAMMDAYLEALLG